MITLCEMCKNKNKKCFSKTTAQNWEQIVNSPECLDFEQDESTKIENLKFIQKEK